MKQPMLKDLTLNKKGTKEIRTIARSSTKIKITVNIDEEILEELKAKAAKSGASYQKLLNQILREGLEGRSDVETRLEKLERELIKIKKKVS